MSRQKLKLYLLSLVLFGILGLLALGLTELILRYQAISEGSERRDHVERTDYLPVRFRPHYEGQFWGIPFTTNRYGFRDEPDFPPQRPPGEFRVLSLGDSIGFGLGVPADQHYTQVAERILAADSPSPTVRVVNAGGQGYSPSGYFVYLNHEGIRLDPSFLVVEIELCNDISDEAFLEWIDEDRDGRPERIEGGRYQLSWDGNLLGTYSTGWSLLDRSYLGTIAVRRALSLVARFGDPRPVPESAVLYSLGFDRILLTTERIERGWENALGAIEGMYELARSNNIPFLLMVMPSRYLYEDTVPYTGLAESLYQRGIALAGERKIPFVGMREKIAAAGGADLFFDFAHLTEKGNQVVGEELAQLLLNGDPSQRSAAWQAEPPLTHKKTIIGLE